MAKWNLSIHPKLGAALDLVCSCALLWWLHAIHFFPLLLVWALVRLVAWFLLVAGVYYPKGFSRLRHAATILYFFCGSTLLLLFIDWSPAWFIIAGLTALAPAISFLLIPASAPQLLSFIIKPWRRWRFMMSAIGFMGFVSGLFAMQALQLVPPLTWWAPTCIGLAAAATGAWWWWEYELPLKATLRSAIVFAVAMGELAAIVSFLPSGYFASALLVTWVWYMLFLLLRFYQTSEGINWRKQGPFLVLSSCLIVGYLGLLRWH